MFMRPVHFRLFTIFLLLSGIAIYPVKIQKALKKEYVCETDLERFCKKLSTGSLRFRCLKKNFKKLEPACKFRMKSKLEKCSIGKSLECKPEYLDRYF
jgi:hypothetical protein